MITFKTVVELHRQPNKTGSLLQKYIFNYFSVPLTYIIVNYTRWTPTTVTLWGFVFYVTALYFFYMKLLTAGFVFYWISFVFDIVDGNVARLKKQSTLRGAYLDIILDWIKPPFAYLFIYYHTGEGALLYLIIINFLAAGSWRIYLNLLPDTSCVRMDTPLKNFRKKKILNLSFISAIEVEFLIVGVYFIDFNPMVVYAALLIRTKDMLKNIVASYLKLRKIDTDD